MVCTIADACIIKNGVYNGTKILKSHRVNFMTTENVNTAIKTLKAKNCKGFD